MQAEVQAHIAFHLTGRKSQGEFDALAGNDLHPAIFAGYRDLTALRYDFPLVLIRAEEGPSVQSLSRLFDGAVKAIAADSDGERLKRHAVRLEREIRKLLAEGVCGSLSKLWDLGAARVGGKDDKLLQDSLSRLRAALKRIPTATWSIATRPCHSACSGTPGKRYRTRRRRNSAPTPPS